MSDVDSETAGSTTAPSGGTKRPPRNVPVVVVWSIIVATAGGCACGMAIFELGTFGAISLWGLGAAAGYVGRKLLGAPSRPVAWCLVVACVVAFVFAEVCWLHWNTVQGQEDWATAVGLLPLFVKEYTVSAVIGAVFTLMGALSAFRQTARQYRIVMIVDE